MKKRLTFFAVSLFLYHILSHVVFVTSAFAKGAKPAEVKYLYQEHCSVCHGTNRLGISGPALLPENLRRLRKKMQ